MPHHPRLRILAALSIATLLAACDSNPIVCDDYGRCGRMGSPPQSSSAAAPVPAPQRPPTLPAPQFNAGFGYGERFTWYAWVGATPAWVCWTLDGSDPTRSGSCAYSNTGFGNEQGGYDYKAEVPVARHHPTLRARSFADGFLPSAIVEVPSLP